MTEEKLIYLEPKLIQKLFRYLPSESFLIMADTEDQIQLWLKERQSFLCVALAWISEQNFQDDWLQPCVKAGLITEETYNLAWLLVTRYQRMWALIRTAYPFIKKEFEQTEQKLPFGCAYDLYSHIIRAETDYRMELDHLPYAEFSAPKYTKAMRSLADEFSGEKLLTNIQLKKLKNLVPKTGKSVDSVNWMQLVLAVAYKRANKRNRLLKYALEDYNTTMSRICHEMATILKNKRSVAIKHGKLIGGSKDGTYSPKS